MRVFYARTTPPTPTSITKGFCPCQSSFCVESVGAACFHEGYTSQQNKRKPFDTHKTGTAAQEMGELPSGGIIIEKPINVTSGWPGENVDTGALFWQIL